LPNENGPGVLFELEAGKGLDESRVAIEIYFKQKKDPQVFVISSLPENAYIKVFRDCIASDQTFFTSYREAIAEWKIAAHILNAWQNSPLIIYKKGAASGQILAKLVYS
jgi:glucose-6-phosphate 1-dehydrogenase